MAAKRREDWDGWSKAAQEILGHPRLTAEAFQDGIKLTDIELAVLQKITSGCYVRNAQTILGAMKLKLEYGYSRPKQIHEVHDVTLEELLKQTLGITDEPETEERTTALVPTEH